MVPFILPPPMAVSASPFLRRTSLHAVMMAVGGRPLYRPFAFSFRLAKPLWAVRLAP